MEHQQRADAAPERGAHPGGGGGSPGPRRRGGSCGWLLLLAAGATRGVTLALGHDRSSWVVTGREPSSHPWRRRTVGESRRDPPPPPAPVHRNAAPRRGRGTRGCSPCSPSDPATCAAGSPVRSTTPTCSSSRTSGPTWALPPGAVGVRREAALAVPADGAVDEATAFEVLASRTPDRPVVESPSARGADADTVGLGERRGALGAPGDVVTTSPTSPTAAVGSAPAARARRLADARRDRCRSPRPERVRPGHPRGARRRGGAAGDERTEDGVSVERHPRTSPAATSSSWTTASRPGTAAARPRARCVRPGPRRVVLAVPVCPREAEASPATAYDDVVAVVDPLVAQSLPWHYDDFERREPEALLRRLADPPP